jgi:hypothetical protein
MHVLLSVIAASLIAVGLVGAVVPALPGIPLIFGGIWLIAGMDHYRHIGLGWLLCIALVGSVGLTLDLLAGALGAKRVGASRRAVWGALLGTLIGTFLRCAGRRTRGRQQHPAFDACGRGRLGGIDLRYPLQTGLVRDHAGAVRCRLVVESQRLSHWNFINPLQPDSDATAIRAKSSRGMSCWNVSKPRK